MSCSVLIIVLLSLMMSRLFEGLDRILRRFCVYVGWFLVEVILLWVVLIGLFVSNVIIVFVFLIVVCCRSVVLVCELIVWGRGRVLSMVLVC